MKQHLVILNPWAGKGTAGTRRAELEQALRDAGIEYVLYATHARGGATEIAWQGVERGIERIVVVGGDGTINEVVNGIKGAEAGTGKRVQLGIVPLGTGSDFIRSFDHLEANDISGAVRRLTDGNVQLVDLGRVQVGDHEPRFFANGLGMGLDAQIAAEARKITKLKGIAVYFLAILRAIATYKAHAMTVRYDQSQVRRRLLFASVANGRMQGGGFNLTPDAKIDDGRLDLCLVDNLRLDEIVRHLPKVLEGTHTQLKQVTMGTATTVSVESAAPIPVATDGEVIATDARSITVEVVPGALEVLV